MVFDLVRHAAELALVVAAIYFALTLGSRRWRPGWSTPLAERRLLVWLLIGLAATAAQVAEEVLGKPAGPLDQAILWFLHRHAPAETVGFFQAVTNCGTSKVLLPLVTLAAVVLAVAERRREAWQLVLSGYGAAALMATLKTAIGRQRPQLWQTDWYWGSSFPSGHTLVTSAVATAAALCIGRLQPRWRVPARAAALLWLAVMGLSRMVLGVHWPSDVLAAACLGILLSLVIDQALALHERKSAAAALQRGGGKPAR